MNLIDNQRRGAQIALKMTIKLIEDVRLIHYLWIFGVVVLSFAGLYYWLTPISNGIVASHATDGGLTFLDAAYFSVVTISSLGYGDVYPVGVSKVLAAVQVLFGLVLMGIMLAKLTSRRLTYHVSRLYGSELQKRLERYARDFEGYEKRLEHEIGDLDDIFRETPGKPLVDIGPASLSRFSELLSQFHSRCLDFIEYIIQETNRGGFFQNPPKVTLERAAKSLEKDMQLIGQLIFSLPDRGITSVMVYDNGERLNDTIARLVDLCDYVAKNSRDMETMKYFESLRQSCKGIPAGRFTTPREISIRVQPDQRLDRGDEPQGGGTTLTGAQ